MKINYTVSVGDILTSVTILISIVTLVISWSKDRQIRKRELANTVREAATIVLSKLERWKSLSMSLYDEIQPVFVETSEMLGKDFDIITARDYLWKQINESKTKVILLILQEEIENAYINLYSYFPSIRQIFLTTIADLKAYEDETIVELLEMTQNNVLSFQDKQQNYTTAMLGNALRESAYHCQKNYQQRLEQTLEPITRMMADFVLTSDDKIFSKQFAFATGGVNIKTKLHM